MVILIGLAILLAGLCGPSKEEKDQAASSAAFTQNLRQHYADKYGKMQDTLDKLNNAISTPATLGFSPAERATYNTQALETTAGNYANAKRAIANYSAGRGDSGGAVQSGVDQQLQALASTEAAKTLSQEQQGILTADYQTGREEKQKNITGLQALSGLYNPQDEAGESLSSAEQAFNMAKSNREAGQAGWKALAGLGTSLATSLIPGAGAIKGISSGLFKSVTGAASLAGQGMDAGTIRSTPGELVNNS